MTPRYVAGRRTALALAFMVLSLAMVPLAAAHGGAAGEARVVLEPAQVTAGDRLTIVGEGMEPNAERVVVLAGQQLVVQFGTLTTDAAGGFSLRVTVPAHLPAGVYQVQAIGDETISASLQVSAAAGAPAANAPPPEAIVPRPRAWLELGAMAVVLALLVGLGAYLALRAERLAGRRAA